MKLWNGLRKSRRTGVDADVEISEQDGIRYLHLGTDTIQSGMRLTAPDELVLAYTRSMMAFLLFVDEPQHVISVGLGGGSVNKWIYHQFPRASQVVLELNPRVIAAARRYFHVPDDDDRLRVIQTDGAAWLRDHPDSADLIFVDGYDGQSQVKELATPEFYADAAGALNRDGVLVVNLWGSDRDYDTYLQRIEGAFDGQVVCVPALQKGNIIVLAFRRRQGALRWDDLRDRARALEARFGLEFLRFLDGMKRLNPHTDKRLLI